MQSRVPDSFCDQNFSHVWIRSYCPCLLSLHGIARLFDDQNVRGIHAATLWPTIPRSTQRSAVNLLQGRAHDDDPRWRPVYYALPHDARGSLSRSAKCDDYGRSFEGSTSLLDSASTLLSSSRHPSQVLAGVVFASTSNFWGLLVAGIVGVISTSGGECGPFIAVEQARGCVASVSESSLSTTARPRLQAAITQVVSIPGSTASAAATQVATLFAIYNALGYAAQASGALASGVVVQVLQTTYKFSARDAYALVFYG